MTNLSIIIISYNTKDITKKCLETVIKSLKFDPTLTVEIIVVDNASTDSSIEMLKKVKSQTSRLQTPRASAIGGQANVKCILNRENVGFSKANNQAAKEAKGEYLLFLNSDIEVIDDAISKIFRFFKSQDDFHFVGGKLLEKDGRPQPSCGPFYSLPVVFAALFIRGDYWGLTRYSPTKVQEVDWVSGACIITKKEFFGKIRGFDEKIFMYMDELDLFYRAKNKGLKVGFFPSAKFIHLGSASSSGRTQPILQVYKGFLYFYKKHFPNWRLKILQIMLELKALISIFIGNLINSQYLVKTYAEAYKIAKNS